MILTETQKQVLQDMIHEDSLQQAVYDDYSDHCGREEIEGREELLELLCDYIPVNAYSKMEGMLSNVVVNSIKHGVYSAVPITKSLVEERSNDSPGDSDRLDDVPAAVRDAHESLRISFTLFNELSDYLDLECREASDASRSNFDFRHPQMTNLFSAAIDYLRKADDSLKEVSL